MKIAHRGNPNIISSHKKPIDERGKTRENNSTTQKRMHLATRKHLTPQIA